IAAAAGDQCAAQTFDYIAGGIQIDGAGAGHCDVSGDCDAAEARCGEREYVAAARTRSAEDRAAVVSDVDITTAVAGENADALRLGVDWQCARTDIAGAADGLIDQVDIACLERAGCPADATIAVGAGGVRVQSDRVDQACTEYIHVSADGDM